LYNHVLYLAYWFVNFLVFYLVSRIIPSDIVLGNWKFTAIEAAIYSSFWLTVLVWTAWDFIYSRGVKFDGGVVTLIYFWIVNTLGVWLIARFAHILGFGITGWIWAVILGAVANLSQRAAWLLVTKKELGRT